MLKVWTDFSFLTVNFIVAGMILRCRMELYILHCISSASMITSATLNFD